MPYTNANGQTVYSLREKKQYHDLQMRKGSKNAKGLPNTDYARGYHAGKADETGRRIKARGWYFAKNNPEGYAKWCNENGIVNTRTNLGKKSNFAKQKVE